MSSPTRSFDIVASWCVKYAADCVTEVATRTLTAEAPNYAVIMEIDRKVREYPFPDVGAPASGTSPPPISEEPLSVAKLMGRLVMSHSKETRKYITFVPCGYHG
jgi:hypothetical protein